MKYLRCTKYVTYDGTDIVEPGQPDSRTKSEWKQWFDVHGDHDGYLDFDDWFYDSLKSGVLEEE